MLTTFEIHLTFLLVSLGLGMLSVAVMLRRCDGSERGRHGPNGEAETASRSLHA